MKQVGAKNCALLLDLGKAMPLRLCGMRTLYVSLAPAPRWLENGGLLLPRPFLYFESSGSV